MNGIEVKGFGYRELIIKASANASGATIRFEDAADKKLWCEVFLDDDAINALAAEVADAKEAAEAEDRGED